MLKNYLTIIIRNFKKDRFHSLVNLMGLMTGLTAFILITLFVREELSYDQFHSEKSSLYRLIQLDTESGVRSGAAPPDYAEILMDEIPGIEGFSRLKQPESKNLIQNGESGVYTHGFFYTDQDFFRLFSFKLIEGNSSVVLDKPMSAVITQSFAKKLFGDTNPVGKELELNKQTRLYVTGVCEDPPHNSTIRFEILARAPKEQFNNTINEGYLTSVTTYLKLAENVNINGTLAQINTSKAREGYSLFFKNMAFELMPITDQHLNGKLDRDALESSDMRMVYLFSGIGFIILLLAVINYINMVIARAMRRTREIGLRKVIGAQKRHLIGYQLLESIVITTISLVMAFALAERLIPWLNSQFDMNLRLNYLSMEFLVFVPLFGLILGLLSGLYPALAINRQGSLALLQNQLNGPGGRGRLRKILVGFQFIVAGIMVLVTVIMHSQMHFLKNKDIGFQKELLVYVPLFDDLKGSSQIFKNEVLTMAGVSSATVTNWMIGDYSFSSKFAGLVDRDNRERPAYVENTLIHGDKDVIPTLGLEILEIEPGFELTDLDTTHTIISQSVVEELGWEGEALGRDLYTYLGEKRRVVAVVANFHSGSYKQRITHAVVELNNISSDENLLIRFESEGYQETLADLKEKYETLLNRPFEYKYVDHEIDKFYRQEADQVSLFNAFSGLALLLSLLGLVAMASYTTRQRQKEVSIRKVLGASIKELLLMLNKEHTWLTIIAFAIATPVAVYAMQDWLANFKYHVTLKPTLFVMAILGFVALNIIITLVYTLRVSRANPAHTLRNE